MKLIFACCLFLVLLSAFPAHGQSAESAREGTFNLTMGGIGSFVEPSFPTAATGFPSNHMFGIGAYVDTRLTPWIQLEGEVRYVRISGTDSQYEDNYLIGPRYTLPRFWQLRPYAKVLIGDTLVNLGADGYAHRMDVTLGGGADMKMSKHLRFRAADFEYHYLPSTIYNTTVAPWDISMGLGYRFF